MEYKEIKTKTESELNKMLAEERSKLTEMRFKDSNRQLKNVRALRAGKKLVAMIITALNELKKKAVK
ncbi:MAG TPA: 50S ribosomal protein L29 [bacterium]|nr:50S ribosomal protein L29 [bacterium]HPT29931.1 50S ribosomal protein L29 [bacterium]